MEIRTTSHKIYFWTIIFVSVMSVVAMSIISLVYQTYYERKKVAEEAVLTVTAEATEFHYQKGLGYININRWQEAKTELELVFDINPNYKDIQSRLKEVYSKIAKLNPTSTPVPITVHISPGYTPDSMITTIVSAVGDPVSTNSSETFDLRATEAYLPTNVWAQIPGAAYIWYEDYQEGPLYFSKAIELPLEATQINGKIEITADNFFNVWLNDIDFEGTAPPDTGQHTRLYTLNLTNFKPGTNQLMIRASELIPGSPSMLVYKLTITYSLP